MRVALAVAALSVAAPLIAQTPAPAPAARPAPRSILFIGNSYTHCAHSAVRNWRADSVTDLNGNGYGGMPALFKAFTDQAGQDYAVSLETQGGKSLGFHFTERRTRFDRPWDVVVLQDLSILDRAHPGDATQYLGDVRRLSNLVAARNPRVQIYLTATWSRADATYRGTDPNPGWTGRSPWAGKPITQMAIDMRAAAERARRENPAVTGIIPAGETWNRAFADGIADPNPYDGVDYGKVDLWTYDQHHASIAGCYLEALVVFGRITGIDPKTLGSRERAAGTLGLGATVATRLQTVASAQLAAEATR